MQEESTEEKIEALQKEWQEETNRLVNEARKETYLAQSKRNELLQVATQLAAGMNANGCTDNGSLQNINNQSVIAAKHLIDLVDAECAE